MKDVKYTFFWAEPTCRSCPFSQWMESEFIVDDIAYNGAEQYMMAGKARLFGDEETLAKIMGAKHPGQQKKLGREVKGFDPVKWDKHCRQIVLKGNLAKFTQNRVLKNALKDTIGTFLVESSPYDKVWGIGIGTCDPDRLDPSKWKGTNYLGEVLTVIRRDLFKDPEDEQFKFGWEEIDNVE